MKCFAALCFALGFYSMAHAQHQTLTVNPDASRVSIKLNTTHEVVNGVFHISSGSIEFDQDQPTMSGMITVAAPGGTTGNGSRDKKMSKDILKVDQFTTITFAPRTYSGTIKASGDSTIQVSGVLTLLGSPHDLTIPMQVHLDTASALAKAEFIIPYVHWGLKNPSFLIWRAENNVTVYVTLSGRLSQ